MAISRKWRLIGIASAVALCIVFLPQLAGAAETEVIEGKEKVVVSDTIVNPDMEAPVEGMVRPERPFHDRRENLPAGTAIIGESSETVDVVNYASSVASRTPNELILNTVISKPEDDATLSRLASKVYLDNGGQNYENVTIFWHVGDKPQPAAPWGRTDIRKGSAVFEVVKLNP